MTWEFTCPVCNTDNTVLPVGPKKSPILIVGEYPGAEELKQGKPFVGATGGVFKTELSKHHIDMNRIRITNMWLHEPNKNAECLEYGIKKVLEEAKDRAVILLVGSATVKQFCGLSVEGYNGLVVESLYFPNATVMACVQPATVFHGSCGELRFAMTEFEELLRKKGLL